MIKYVHISNMFLPNWLSFLPNAWNWSGLDYSMGAPFMPTCLVPWWVEEQQAPITTGASGRTNSFVKACYILLQMLQLVTHCYRSEWLWHFCCGIPASSTTFHVELPAGITTSRTPNVQRTMGEDIAKKYDYQLENQTNKPHLPWIALKNVA